MSVLLQEEMAHHAFAIPPERLIAMAKEVLSVGVHKWKALAKDFTFTGKPEAQTCKHMHECQNARRMQCFRKAVVPGIETRMLFYQDWASP